MTYVAEMIGEMKRVSRGKGHRSDTEECRELVWNKIGMGKAVAKTVKEVVLAAAI